ncbi:MAG: PKD domain-containing protein [Methanolinea sp.]|nr:PKD domain-containing protein [Methanolinea sp.]
MVRQETLVFIFLFSGLVMTGLFPIAVLADMQEAEGVEPASSGTSRGTFEGITHPYNGFRCSDRSPIVGGNLTFEVNTTAIRDGPVTIRYLKIDWGDGSPAEWYETPYEDPEESQAVRNYTVRHVYTRAEPFVIRVQGSVFRYVQYNDHTYVQELSLDLSLRKGDILVHSIDDTSFYSSPLSPYVPGHWTHSGMYIGGNKVLEAGGHGIAINDISDWAYPRDVCVAIFRVPGLREDQRNNVVNWGLEKVDHDYDFQSLTGLYNGKQRDCDEFSCWKYAIGGAAAGTAVAGPGGTVTGAIGGYWACKKACAAYYCSELVWASYERNGINLDPIDGCVYPMDTVLGRYVPMEFVGCHMEYLPVRIKAYGSTHEYYRMLMGLQPGSIVRGEYLDPLPSQPISGVRATIADYTVLDRGDSIDGEVEPRSGEEGGSFFMLLIVANSDEMGRGDAFRSNSCVGCSDGSHIPGDLIGKDDLKRPTMFSDPFDTEIRDPDGNRMTENSSTIPDSTFEILDIDSDPFDEFLTSIESPAEGDYRISVIPEGEKGSGYSYSLRIGAWDSDQISWIAPVDSIPFTLLPENGNITLRIGENGYSRIIAAPAQGDAPLNVSFMDISPMVKSGSYWDYDTMESWNQWDFGDGTGTVNQTTTTHLYPAPGEYLVELTTRNATMSAKATMIVNVGSVGPTLVPDFAANPVSGTAPLNVTFSDLSSGNPSGWLYQFGDGAVSRNPNPVHSYQQPGTYEVSLTVRKTGEGVQASNTTVKPAFITVTAPQVSPLIADFSASPTTGPAPLAVQFQDTSTGNIFRHLYRFGDGAISGKPNPSHTYRRTGTYSVSHTVWKLDGGKMVSNTTVRETFIKVV